MAINSTLRYLIIEDISHWISLINSNNDPLPLSHHHAYRSLLFHLYEHLYNGGYWDQVAIAVMKQLITSGHWTLLSHDYYDMSFYDLLYVVDHDTCAHGHESELQRISRVLLSELEPIIESKMMT
jgi:hypothetical protein